MGKTGTDDIKAATASYEDWLRRFTQLNEADLEAKHKAMASEAFPFLRATFYRWAEQWPKICPELAATPVVLAVGDLHAENFGTWRDAEGRLVFGVNDFDEAFPLPYANDLVRLATSVLLAVDGDELSVDGKGACEAILRGYSAALDSGGRPFVIDEENQWFVPLLQRKAKAGDPAHFWNHLRESCASLSRGRVPPGAAAALSASLPPGSEEIHLQPRRAGVGSLGKPRFVALAQWLGGPVAREVKALAPSACVWAAEAAKGATPAEMNIGTHPATAAGHIQELIGFLTEARLRCPDPHFRVAGEWVCRRLACDSRKVELKASPKEPDEIRLLEAMGSETANIHLGSASVTAAVRNDLAKRGHKWLFEAASEMRDATTEDQKVWARGH